MSAKQSARRGPSGIHLDLPSRVAATGDLIPGKAHMRTENHGSHRVLARRRDLHAEASDAHTELRVAKTKPGAP